MNNYKESKNWNMNIGFENLIRNNKTCKIDLDPTCHFDSYNGISIYVSHPLGRVPFSIGLGVTRDGFVYECDYEDEGGFEEIPIEEGLKILEQYRQLVNIANDLENTLLLNNKLAKKVVEVNIR